MLLFWWWHCRALLVKLFVFSYFFTLFFFFFLLELRHFANIFHDWVTSLKLGECSHFWLFKPLLLELYPMLACYANSTPGRFLIKSFSENRLKRRSGRWGGASCRLQPLLNNGRLTLPVILLANFRLWKTKYTSSMPGSLYRGIYRIVLYYVSAKLVKGRGCLMRQ